MCGPSDIPDTWQLIMWSQPRKVEDMLTRLPVATDIMDCLSDNKWHWWTRLFVQPADPANYTQPRGAVWYTNGLVFDSKKMALKPW